MADITIGTLRTLRWVFVLHMGEVYDDPFDVDAAELTRLEQAGHVLGVNIWDREQLREHETGHNFSDIEYNRLREIAGSHDG